MEFDELITYAPKHSAHNFIDLTGTETEYFKVISRAPNGPSSNRVRWNCLCKSCGKYCVKDSSNLYRHKSCGCSKNKNIGKALRKDITGNRYGKLTAIKDTGKSNKSGNAIWQCQCDCGRICEVDRNNLITLHTYSCGCIKYSIGAENILNILTKNNISYLIEYPIYNIEDTDSAHPYRFDFAILDNDNNVIRLIEYDGIQHFQEGWGAWKSNISLKEQQRRDNQKNEWAIENNIPLVRIPYWERDNITMEMIFGSQYEIKK